MFQGIELEPFHQTNEQEKPTTIRCIYCWYNIYTIIKIYPWHPVKLKIPNYYRKYSKENRFKKHFLNLRKFLIVNHTIHTKINLKKHFFWLGKGSKNTLKGKTLPTTKAIKDEHEFSLSFKISVEDHPASKKIVNAGCYLYKTNLTTLHIVQVGNKYKEFNILFIPLLS